MQTLVLGQIAIDVLVAERKRRLRLPPLALLLCFSKRPVAISLAVESPDVVEALLAVRISSLPLLGHLGLPSIPAMLDGHRHKRRRARGFGTVPAPIWDRLSHRATSQPVEPGHHPGITCASMPARTAVDEARDYAG